MKGEVSRGQGWSFSLSRQAAFAIRVGPGLDHGLLTSHDHAQSQEKPVRVEDKDKERGSRGAKPDLKVQEMGKGICLREGIYTCKAV